MTLEEALIILQAELDEMLSYLELDEENNKRKEALSVVLNEFKGIDKRKNQ